MFLFDHMFGGFPGVNGASTGMRDGVEVPLTRAPQWLPGDLPHDWGATFRHVNGGKMDGFGEGGHVPISDAFAYSRFEEEDIPNLWGWARDFAISDNFFASAKGNSYAQHLYMVAGQSGRAYDAPIQSPAVRLKRTKQGLAKTWGCDVPEGGYLLVVPEGKVPGEDDQKTKPCLDIGSQGEPRETYSTRGAA